MIRDPPRDAALILRSHASYVRGSAQSAEEVSAPLGAHIISGLVQFVPCGGWGLRPDWQPGCTIHSSEAGVLRIFVALHVWLDHPALPSPAPSCSPHLIISASLQSPDVSAASCEPMHIRTLRLHNCCPFRLSLEGVTGNGEA